MEKNLTLGQLADSLEKSPDTMRKHFVRTAKRLPELFPDKAFSVNRPVSDEQAAILSARKRPDAAKAKKKARLEQATFSVFVAEPSPAPEPPAVEAKPEITPAAEAYEAMSAPQPNEAPAPGHTRRPWAFWLILAAPTLASVRNMYHVTGDIAGDGVDAALLTVVLAIAAPGFIYAGVRAGWAVFLAIVLVAFESFCNLTRIYGGLMGVGTTGNPTRFLGLVCDIFGSGSHWTAVVLGGITALFIAAVQYAAIFELNRK